MEQSDETRALIEKAIETWSTMKSRDTFDDWLVIGFALEAGSRDVMAAHGLNRRNGKKWSGPWGDWLRMTGLIDVDASARSYLLKIMDELPALQQWRTNLNDEQRRKINHPQRVWSAFNSSRRGPNEDRRVNPLEIERDKLRHELDEANAEIERVVAHNKELETEVERLHETATAPSERFGVQARETELLADLEAER